MREVYELDVYKLAEELSDRIWSGFDTWSKKVQQTIGYQIIKASDSIASNLAEGYGRYTPPDRKLFYRYATELINELGPKLNAFIRRTGYHSRKKY